MVSFSTFFDRITPRPQWAGDVEIALERARMDGALSDVRGAGNAGRTVWRPKAVRGIVAPVSTRGRQTADVCYRDLAGTPWDRGHLMALSLGAPDTSSLMAPQPRGVNQNTHNSVSNIADTTWREMEIYTAFIAREGMDQQSQFVPRTDDQVGIFGAAAGEKSVYIYRQGQQVLGGPLRLPTPKQYRAGGANAVPRYVVEYRASPHYRRRGNTPSSVTVTLTLIEPSARTELLSKIFLMLDKVNVSYAITEKIMRRPLMIGGVRRLSVPLKRSTRLAARKH